MEAFLAIVAGVLVLVALDVASLRWGADSRPNLADDHRR
jgi:hypothetical protein